jgi:regulator of protease activity HflC (stomatin/prohibitin superfamily)
MAEDRGKAAAALKDTIVKQADGAELGIEIVFLGFRGVHPPAEVAKEFEEVANSMSKKEIEILKAERDAGMALTAVAGDQNLADRLYQAIKDLEPQTAEGIAEVNTLAMANKTLEPLLAQLGGHAAEILNTAKAKAYETVTVARSQTEGIDLEAASYQAAPDYYRRRRRLEVLSDAIKDKPKKVISFIPKDGAIIKIPGEEQEYFDTKSFRDTE